MHEGDGVNRLVVMAIRVPEREGRPLPPGLGYAPPQGTDMFGVCVISAVVFGSGL